MCIIKCSFEKFSNKHILEYIFWHKSLSYVKSIVLGYTESMQEEMEKLKLLVENYLEEKYCYPDVLYSFMDKVLDDKTE